MKQGFLRTNLKSQVFVSSFLSKKESFVSIGLSGRRVVQYSPRKSTDKSEVEPAPSCSHSSTPYRWANAALFNKVGKYFIGINGSRPEMYIHVFMHKPKQLKLCAAIRS